MVVEEVVTVVGGEVECAVVVVMVAEEECAVVGVMAEEVDTTEVEGGVEEEGEIITITDRWVVEDGDQVGTRGTVVIILIIPTPIILILIPTMATIILHLIIPLLIFHHHPTPTTRPRRHPLPFQAACLRISHRHNRNRITYNPIIQ